MKRSTIIKSGIGLLVIGIVTAGLVFRFVINKPHPDYSKAKPAHILTAADLYDSFRSDKQLAETKFNGQVVLLTGKLDKVEINGSLATGVFVFDQGVFGDEGVRCTMLPDQANELANHSKGSEIRLKGYLTGFNETDVILESCSIIR